LFSRAHSFQRHSLPEYSGVLSDRIVDYYDTQIQQLVVNMLVSGTSSLSGQAIMVTRVLPGQTEWSRPEHDVIEGIMTLADDKRPEEILLIGLT